MSTKRAKLSLNRTQPGLPLKKGRCGTMTHDYKRNGTTTLSAALDRSKARLSEMSISDTGIRSSGTPSTNHREFSGKTPLHLVIDNYGTHGTAEAKAWLKKVSRYVMKYAPTSQLAEPHRTLVRRVDNKRIRRHPFLSVDELTAAIEESSPLGTKIQAIHLDRHRGLYPRQARSLSSNFEQINWLHRS